MSESEPLLLMDAIRMVIVHATPANLLFKHVLSMPVPCPGQCSEQYIIAVNLPVVLEIEMGLMGKKHLACLYATLKAKCKPDGRIPDHIRTDGETVWSPA